MIINLSTNKKRILNIFFSLFLLINFSLQANVPVKVVKTIGGPQISVNNVIVRPRMLWGANRGGFVTANEQWKEFSFEVNVPFEANATWHFRFGKESGEIWITDIKLINAETGEAVFPNNTFKNIENFKKSWNVYPPDSNNTVGTIEVVDSSLHVILTEPPSGEPWPDFHLYSDAITLSANTSYRYSFKIRANQERDISPQVYHVNNGWTYIGGPPSLFMEEIQMAKDVGVNFITFNASNCWLPPNEDDNWLPLDVVCQQIINTNPKALLIPRISMDAPSWWLAENPDALMVFEDGTKGTQASISNRKYREDASNHLEKLAKHLKNTFPDNLAGIHPSGQNTGEWFYDKTWESKLSGYDIATKEAWQNYTNGNSEIPSPESRRPAIQRLLLNPELDKDVIDFNNFLQEEMADFIIALSDAARKGLGNDKLIMFFYGYQYEFANVYNGPATSGHYALNKILNSANIDILSAPVSYYDRNINESGPVMSSVESVLKSGKFWLNEDDTRTYLNKNLDDQKLNGGLNTLEETQSVLLRNAAQSAIRGYGAWWMDHGAGTFGGWFADPELWKVMDYVKELDDKMLVRSDYYSPKIALIISEQSMLHIAGGSNILGKNLIYNSRSYFARTGTTYGQYMLNDALSGNIPSKFKVFLATWVLDDKTRADLINSRKEDETRVWCYAPGYITSDGTSLKAMKELTGFEFQKIEINSSIATPTETGIMYGITNPWGLSQKVTPLFTVNPDSCIVLATYNNGQPAVAIKNSNYGTDIFVGTPQLPTEVIRALAENSDVEFFSKENLNIWSAENYCAFHTAQTGNLNLHIDNNNLPIFDAISGQGFGTNSNISINVDAGETRIFKWNSTTDINLYKNSITKFKLDQNYPNPFNPSTTIKYSIPVQTLRATSQHIKLVVYDILGREVATLVNKEQKPGNYEVSFDASKLTTSIYFYKLQSGSLVETKKMLLLK